MSETLALEFIALQQAVAGRYSLERELGRGGMGIVFLARDVALDRPVAIKLLPPTMAAQPGLRERFLREAQTAAKLSHPNIVPIHAVEQAGDLVYFVMGFVEGETLGQRLRAKGPLPPATGVRMLQEVAWALAYAHLRGIVHRDVKPDNILLEAGGGRALVTDFGIARATEISGGTAVGEILGTAQFMSPEQASGETVDGRSDIYSLGCVGFYAMSGKLPFEAPDIPALLAQHITRPAPPLSSMAPGVPRRVAQAIDRCLAKNAEDRWPTGEAFAEALAQGTAVVREVPAPIRVWLTKGEGMRPVLYGWTAMVGMVTIGQFVAYVFGGEAHPGPGVLVAIGVPWLLFELYRSYHTQRVLAAGYGLEDLRLALRQQVEKRREELAFEFEREPPIWAKAIRKLTFAALGVATGCVAALFLSPAWMGSPVLTGTLVASMLTALGGGVLGRIFPGKRLKARDSMLEYRARLLNGPVGEQIVKLSLIGLKRPALPAPMTNRPTELAIGMAADQIFESLAKETRRELKDLPRLARRLEAEAGAMRARVEELDAMLAGLGGEAPAVRSASLQGSVAGHVVQGQQQKLRADLVAKRDESARRLAVTVAALENIRLDLLRLKAGVGTVDRLTADLAQARDLHAEIERALEARAEVEAALDR